VVAVSLKKKSATATLDVDGKHTTVQ